MISLLIGGHMSLTSTSEMLAQNLQIAQARYPSLTTERLEQLRTITLTYRVSLNAGDLILIEGTWYITHPGLLRIAAAKKCAGIRTMAQPKLSDPASSSWVFKAVVFKSRASRGFIGYGDASPANVSSRVLGSEMRVAETRAVNRALRKAYAVGICSFEELGPRNGTSHNLDKVPAVSEPATLRRRLCSLISHYGLNAAAVKRYAAEFCGTQEVREATRELVEDFFDHLSASLITDSKAVIEHLKQYETGGVQ
jgi:hypothetical protein